MLAQRHQGAKQFGAQLVQKGNRETVVKLFLFSRHKRLGQSICVRIEHSRHLVVCMAGIFNLHEINARAPGAFSQPLVETVLAAVAVVALYPREISSIRTMIL